MLKEGLLDKFSEKGYLISSDLSMENINYDELYDYLLKKYNNKEGEMFVIDNDIIESFKNEFTPKLESVAGFPDINTILEESSFKKTTEFSSKIELKPKIIAPKKDFRGDIETNIEIIKNHTIINKKKSISSFISHYSSRFEKIKNMLLLRGDIKDIININKVGDNPVSVIGLVKHCNTTKSGNFIIELEDMTDTINILITPSSEDFVKTSLIVLDEVIAISGKKSGRFFYGNKIFFPEFPEKERSSSKEDVVVAFASDIHIGSNMFLEKKLLKFIDWLNLKKGNEKQMELASKVKYLVIPGDLIDGIGIYPGQEKELNIPDVYKQYAKFAEYFENIPETIELIVSPGNHDAVRMAEPQPPLYKDFAEPIYKMSKKINILSNPCFVNLHKKDDYPGSNVLIYHGYSFDHYIAEVPFLRKYGYEKIEYLLKFLLDKRHLAPTHGSTLFTPGSDELIIENIPDIFATGHIHKARIDKYKGAVVLSSSCFQGRTSFQEKVGHHPEPGKIP
ncbi:MAG: metallophosphoesterase, partial [Candidatus Omnitrophica bacterium]|nr:metallophosphoesterase [Candidatus Omnitrophota bacterium]